MRRGIRGLIVVGLMIGALAVPTVASDPMGVYCVIEKVTLEPADCPVRAEVHGVCAIANTNNWGFQSPARGYFSYAVPAGREETARAEWKDLKSAEGTGQVVGFGRRYNSVGKFRPENESPASPDTYPLHLGVFKVTGRAVAPEVTEIAQKLRAFRTP